RPPRRRAARRPARRAPRTEGRATATWASRVFRSWGAARSVRGCVRLDGDGFWKQIGRQAQSSVGVELVGGSEYGGGVGFEFAQARRRGGFVDAREVIAVATAARVERHRLLQAEHHEGLVGQDSDIAVVVYDG